jgi:hypothetical protein
MVGRVAFIAVCILLASCASRDCSPASEFEPALCALSLPQITRLDIHENAAGSSLADAATRCDDFRLSESQLRMYFSAARQADTNDVHHTLDWSPCHASGEVHFNDGRSGRWTISQSRIGSLAIGGDDAITLYCPRCRFTPFK